MNNLYKTLDISKQAVFQYQKRQEVFDTKTQVLLLEASELRKEHPGCGVEKMYTTLKPNFIGRDRFVALFMELGFRLNKKQNYRRTTYAGSIYYPNLIKGMFINAPSIVWQSDITYIYVAGNFYYAVLIIDVFTKIIVGYQLSDHMRATANIKALNMALKVYKEPNIHHSDKGSQYTSKQYLKILKDNNSQISMALSAQDNAYAERINRTIKEEYLDHWKPENFNQLKKCVKKAVEHYNHKRPHNNIGKLTPIEFKLKWENNNLVKNNNFTIFNNEELLKNGQH
jgi:transposase InsO family protein